MEIKQLTNEEFKTFTKSFNYSSVFQTTNYAFTMNEEGFDSIFLGLLEGKKIVAVSLIMIRKINGFKYAYAPRGYLIDYNNLDLVTEFTNQIKKYLGKKDIVAIKISPLLIKNIYNSENKVVGQNMSYDMIFNHLKKLKYYHLGYNNNFEALKPRFEAAINLNLPYTHLFANIKKNFRTKIRKAERDGIKVYHGNESHLDYLYEHTKKKYPRDLSYFKDLYKFFGKENLIDFYYSKLDTTEYLKITQKLYSDYQRLSNNLNNELIRNGGNNEKVMNEKIAVDRTFEKYKFQLAEATNYLREFPNGIILSSALVVKWKDEVYLIIDGYDHKYKKFNGKHLLLWKLISRYSKLGFKTLNLGGVANVTKPSKKYDGLNEFKLNFNSQIIEYAGDFELITNSPLYFMYQKSISIGNMLKPSK